VIFILQWNLVCEDAALNTIISTIYMSGLLVGALLFGSLSDRSVLT